jgi:hypothetical protein
MAVALLGAVLLLAACGSEDEDPVTTTVTTVEGETGESETAETTPESPQAGSSDAGQVSPGGDSTVATTTTDEATGETTTTDPATGEAVTTTEGAATGETTVTTPEATDPAGTPLTTGTETGVQPLLPASPVLPGDEGAILSRPFSADSPWNTPVSDAAVDRRSNSWMRLAEIRVAQVERRDGEFERQRRRIDEGLTVNVTRWTVPVFSNLQQGAVQRVAVCRQIDCGPDAVTSVTIPRDACPEPEYDGWMTVIDNDNRDAYDFWRARCEADGSISYHYVKRWDVDGPGFQEPLGVSARGSGLPLFAGLITPEEIRDGRIEHALAISVPGAAQRRYVQPASRTDGTGLLASLPEGARIRLRPGANDLLSRTFVRNRKQREAANTIIAALERYGAIVVDRAAAPTLYAQRNANWTGTLPLNLLQDIGLRRFEVVESGPILFDPPREGEPGFGETPPETPGSVPGGSGGTTEFGSPDTERATP